MLQFLSISHNKASYKIPVDQIEEIKVSKVNFRVVGALIGIVADLSMLALISVRRSGIIK